MPEPYRRQTIATMTMATLENASDNTRNRGLQQIERFLVSCLVYTLPVSISKDLVFRYNLSGPSGLSITIPDIFLFLLLMNWFFNSSHEDRSGKKLLPMSSLPLLYLCSTLPSFFNTIDYLLSFAAFIYLAKMCIIFYLIGKLPGAVSHIHKTMLHLQIILTFAVLFNRYIFPIENLYGFALLTYRSKNAAGAVLAFLLLVRFGTLFGKQAEGRLKGRLFFILGAVALLASPSRGAWLSFLVGFLFFVIVGFARQLLSSKAAAGALVIVILVGMAGMPFLKTRNLNFNDREAQDRIELNRIAIKIIKNHPLVGIGLGNYMDHMKAYMPETEGFFWVYVVHNNYLLVAAETGLFSLAFFIMIFVNAISSGIKFKSDESANGIISLSYAAGLSGFATHMLADYFVPGALIGWLIWISLASVNVLKREWDLSSS